MEPSNPKWRPKCPKCGGKTARSGGFVNALMQGEYVMYCWCGWEKRYTFIDGLGYQEVKRDG